VYTLSPLFFLLCEIGSVDFTVWVVSEGFSWCLNDTTTVVKDGISAALWLIGHDSDSIR
jgi:hypothetical protein